MSYTWKSMARLLSLVLEAESRLPVKTLPVDAARFRMTSGTVMLESEEDSDVRFSLRPSLPTGLAFVLGKVSAEPLRTGEIPSGFTHGIILFPDTFSILPDSLAVDSWKRNGKLPINATYLAKSQCHLFVCVSYVIIHTYKWILFTIKNRHQRIRIFVSSQIFYGCIP